MKGNGIRLIKDANCNVLPPVKHRSKGELCSKQIPALRITLTLMLWVMCDGAFHTF